MNQQLPHEFPCSFCSKTMFILQASQIILGTAIIMGLAALVTLLLKVCSKPRNRPSQTAEILPDEFGRMGIRASLSSLQQRIMSKLRDPPPKYETKHNYDVQTQQGTTRIAVLNPGAASAPDRSNLPPPAYENTDDPTVRIVVKLRDCFHNVFF